MTSTNTPNAYGVYPVQEKAILATHGSRSIAAVELCHCDDGRYRYGLSLAYSCGGFGFPISDHEEGFATYREALDAGTRELLGCFPFGSCSDPQSVRDELAAMRTQLEGHLHHPTLF